MKISENKYCHSNNYQAFLSQDKQGERNMNKIYGRMTKKFLTGNLKGFVVSDILEAANEECAKRDVARLPKGSIFKTIGGSQVEVMAHDYVIE